MFHGGGVYSGVLGYANGLKLLTPTVKALHILTNTCIKYADKYDILFNVKKSLLMIYKCTKNCPLDPAIIINDVQVPRVHEGIHLGHKLSDDIYKFSSTKCVEDFNRQSNIFLVILSIPTLISEMPYFKIIALLFMAIKFYHYLAIVWRISIQLGELRCVESGGFHGELIIICYLILLV